MGFIGDALAAKETIATAAWVGAAAGFAFIAAPTIAHEANNLDLQAKITGATLDKIATFTYVAAGGAAACALLRAFGPRERANDLARAILGAGAIALIYNFQNEIVPEMTRLQHAMGGSFQDVPKDDPNRVAYRAVHEQSTRVFGGALLLGIAQLALGAARKNR
jgi:hypothetical protein